MNYIETLLANTGTQRAWSAKTLASVALALVCSFISVSDAFAQKSITGKVTASDTKKPIAGAKITARSNSKTVGAFSKADGSYSISVPDGVSNLLVEYVGMKKQTIAISGDVVDIVMKEDVLQLQELVVTGIGITQEKKQLTYAAQEVKAAELTSNRQVNAINALAGQVAGVQVNASSGSPGAASFIRIRGFSSIAGRNQPLFVVDGVPIDNTVSANSGTNQGGVDVANRALDINPDDIESVNVLKGAAATALYGIQAGPGAIIITTKKGKNDGIINVSYSFTKGFDQVNKLPELQTKFIQGRNGLHRNPSTAESLSWGPAVDTLFWDGATNFDWDANGNIIGQTAARGNASAKKFTPYDNLANFFTTGQTDIHNLNFSGGNNLGKFYFAITQSRNTGIVPNTSLDKTTLRLNADYKLGQDFTLGANIQYNRTGQVAVERGSNVGGIMLGLLRTPISFDNANSAAGVTNPGSDIRSATFAPTSARYVNDGGALNQRTYRGTGIYDNPFWVVQRNLFNANTNRILGNAVLTYAPQSWFGSGIGDLNITWRMGIDNYTTVSGQNTAINSVNNPAGAILNVDENSQILNSDLLLTLSKEIDENTRYSLLIGNNAYQNSLRTYRTFATNLAVPEFYNISNAIDPALVTETLNQYRLGGWYGKFDLSLLKEAININGTVRADWSTTLPAVSNPFLSYSGAVAVILSDLLQLDQETLSFIKLRGSFGRIGNDAGGLLYLTNTPVTRGNPSITDGWVNNGVTFPLNGVAGFRKFFTVGSGDNLRAEAKTEYEAGLDLKFFQNRLSLDLAYFSNTVDDLIIPVQIATSSGYQQRNVNAASIRNNGLEAVLGATLVQTEDFTLKATINWSRLETVVTKLAPGIPNFLLGGFVGNGIYAWEGRTYGQIVGQGFKRNAQGRILIDDDGYPLLTDTLAPWGANVPDWQAGIRLAASFKGLSVSALLDIKQGGKMWNGTRGALNNFGKSKESEDRGKATFTTGGGLIQVRDNVFQGVVESTGQENTKKVENIGRDWWGNLGSYNVFNTNLAEAFVEDAGWVRLRELTISYAFPKELVGSTGFLSGVELFATARNLWLSTGYSGVDPETNLENSGNSQGFEYFNNPGTRSYMFGIKVNF